MHCKSATPTSKRQKKEEIEASKDEVKMKIELKHVSRSNSKNADVWKAKKRNSVCQSMCRALYTHGSVTTECTDEEKEKKMLLITNTYISNGILCLCVCVQ